MTEAEAIERAAQPRYRIETVEVDVPARRVRVRWGDRHESTFHFVWLRHRCFYPANSGVNAEDESLRAPDDPEMLSVEVLERERDRLTIRWADGTTTRHEARWLRDNCYSAAARAARKHRPVLWDGVTAERLPWFDFEELGDQNAVYRLYLQVRDYGLARIRNVTTKDGTIEKVARLFGPIHETHYGRVFDIRTTSHFQIEATKSTFVGPHTDENYRHAPPGISFFHCLQAHPKGGGTSILVDGFLAASRLAQTDPEAFDLLSRVPIRFVHTVEPDDKLWAYGRVICRDVDGEIVGIRYTDRTLPPLDLPEELIEPMYRALRAFAQELYAPDLPLRYSMKPGDLHVFDNQRVLHGRTAFDPTAGVRHLQQCAVDRDEFHNRLRLVALERGLKDTGLIMVGGALG